MPAALAVSAFIPWAVLPLLMIGGFYLCTEGVEKIAHKWLHTPEEDASHRAGAAAVADEQVDLAAYEADKIKNVVPILCSRPRSSSGIALGTVASQPFVTQLAVLSGIGLIMTIGVYGIVAGIVRMDDLGLYLLQKGNVPRRKWSANGCCWRRWLMASIDGDRRPPCSWSAAASSRTASGRCIISSSRWRVASVLGGVTTLLLNAMVRIVGGAGWWQSGRFAGLSPCSRRQS